MHILAELYQNRYYGSNDKINEADRTTDNLARLIIFELAMLYGE